MHIIKELWTVKEFHDNKDNIDPRPQYQRSLVWDLARKQYLIDSILRGYDIPKIYLKGSKQGEAYKFEITDGQQRLNAIWSFYNDEFPLPRNSKINGTNIGGLYYSGLTREVQKIFREYEINVSNIDKSEPWELNDLFTRLQKGMSLLPVELRHAMMSEMKDAIEKLLKHKFFKNSKIEDRRFKRQEYLDHALAACHFGVETDLKAPTLFTLYSELSEDKDQTKVLSSSANKVLYFMNKINDLFPGIFKNKWGFVDVFSVLYRNIHKIADENIDEIASRLDDFEKDRKTYVSKSDLLLESTLRVKHKRDLYKYIQAFNREGAFKNSVKKRYEIMEKVLLK
jgi:hypothetical protein